MRLLRCFVALAVLLALAIPSFATPPEKKGKKKKNAPFRGTVVEVKAVDGKEEGILIVKGVAGKKKNAPADPQEKTFKVTTGTKIETRGKKKDAVPGTPIKLSAIEKGQRIVVVGKDDTADDIKVQAAKKKNKKKKKDA